jgi:hypothetical protein
LGILPKGLFDQFQQMNGPDLQTGTIDAVL